jgi:hypothetical protein
MKKAAYAKMYAAFSALAVVGQNRQLAPIDQ